MSSRELGSKAEKIAKPDAQFDQIAFLYDELMVGVPYRLWADHIGRILKRFQIDPKSMLDLCCGTGTVSLLLAEKGYDVTGVDISPEMVEHARRKAAERCIRVDFHAQDASKLRIGKRFDLVASLFDSLNYILEASALQDAFHRVSAHMAEGGLFIFDMNTELALAVGLFDQNNLGSRGPVIYNWHSAYDPGTRICTIRMDYLYRRGGEEKRVNITHYQRAYDKEEIVEMLETSGLQVLAAFDGYSLRKATKRSDRIFFVARK
jgi:ubiquinone/menaquinone biosynthesis C-methylase UbiE